MSKKSSFTIFSEQLAEAERERVERQRLELGPEGLARKKAELEAAVASQEALAPSAETLESFEMASVESVKFLEFTTYTKWVSFFVTRYLRFRRNSLFFRSSSNVPDNFDLRSIPHKVHLNDVDALRLISCEMAHCMTRHGKL